MAVAASWVFALLLVTAGTARLRYPERSGPVLELLPARWDRPSLGRGLGMTEVCLGAAAIGLGGPIAFGALAVAALALTAIAALQRYRGHGCGCFGAAEPAPVTRLHIALNGLAGGSAAVATGGAAPSVVEVIPTQPLSGVPLLVGLAVTTGAVRLAMTALPVLEATLALLSTEGAG